MAESSSDSTDEFYDAEEVTPKSRSGSLLRQVQRQDESLQQNPAIRVSSPLTRESLSLDLEHSHNSQDANKQNEFLPEEISQELEALSRVDVERNSRIARLERLRRGEGQDMDEENDDALEEQEAIQKQFLHDSAESSVEGIYVSGSRQSHPFKVIEQDSDRRSVSSETRSGTMMMARPNSMPRFFEPFDQQKHVPDIVSSVTTETPKDEQRAGFEVMGPPVRPPRRKKTSTASTPAESETGPPFFQLDHELAARKLSTASCSSSARQSTITAIHRRESGLQLSSTTIPELPSDEIPSSPSRLEIEAPEKTSTPRQDILENDDDDDNDEEAAAASAAVDDLTKELEDTFLTSLDMKAATRGQFVVRPTDDDKVKGEAASASANTTMSVLTEEVEGEEPKSATLRTENPFSKSFKSATSTGSSVGRRSSAGVTGIHSLGSNHASAASGSSSGGKRSLHSCGSMDSGASRDVAGLTKQMNLFLRTKSDSGKRLSDDEILKQIKVKNLDTGEEMDLVEAEDRLPSSLNPLSLHIMRLTSEYVSGDRTAKSPMDSDTESMYSSVSGYELGAGKKKMSGMKKFFGNMAKKTSEAAKSIAVEATKKKEKPELTKVVITNTEKEVEKLGRLATEIKSSEGVPEPVNRDGKGLVFKRIQAHKSGPFDFEGIKFSQELSSPHLGPIWCMRFSQCGQLLATAGQDTVLHIWVLKNSYNYFKEMRSRYNADVKSSPTNSYEHVISDQLATEDKSYQVFVDTPFCSYSGHTSDLLDVSWSKNYFILTSSMDKTVRLWHISRRECLCVFQHIDFVTAICFHPRNDQFFLSGSLDGKLRLWNIPDKKVALWNEIDGASKLITTANFIQNGKFAVVGTYDGRCIFYSTDQLKYYTMIHVRSARGKNAEGRKVTGIEPMPGEDKLLVTSNDSRVRLYDLRDLSLSCKYKGYTNGSSQIRASFSHDGKYITSGSENQCVFIWRTHYEQSNNLTVHRKDRNSYYEAIKAHNAVVTCSVFAPNPAMIFDQLEQNQINAGGTTLGHDLSTGGAAAGAANMSHDESAKSESKFNANASFKKDKNKDKTSKENVGPGYVLISGDYDGEIKVFVNTLRPKHSSLPA